jgi:hypothetical protein
MNADVSRRVFVGSVATGLPLVAGAFHGIRASSVVDQVHDHAAANNVDPVFDHLIAEMALIHKRMQSRGPRGEDARAIAAQLRTAVVRGTQVGLDAPTQKALGDLIRTRGRDAVLNIELDRTRVKARLKQYGVAIDEGVFVSADYNTRARALDDLTNTGVSGVLARTTRTFDVIGRVLDQTQGRVARVRRVQTDADWYIGFCAQLQQEMARLGAEAAFVCGMSFFAQPLEIVCAMLEMACAAQAAVYFANCA